MVVVLFCRYLECDIKMNSGLNDNGGIQFVDQENIIIDSNIVQIRAKMQLLPVFGRLNFGDKVSPV